MDNLNNLIQQFEISTNEDKKEFVKYLKKFQNTTEKCLSITEVSKFLGISHNSASEIMHSKGFPSFKPNPKKGTLRVTQKDFNEWVKSCKRVRV